MFLEIKFQNLFFLIFIIILLWVTPLYFVKANEVIIRGIKPKKNPFSYKMNYKPTDCNKLILPAELTFELQNIEETEEGNNYYYKLTFEDNKKTLKELSLFCHLNTSIFHTNESTNDNDDLTSLFDIKCFYKREGLFTEFETNLSESQTFYEIDRKEGLKKQERKFSFSKIDLKEWAYDIKIEIKTKSQNHEQYKKLENKKIKLKCELDITDKDNYPAYLFNLFDQFQNLNKYFPNFFRIDFDFYEYDNSLNPIWIVFKDKNEFFIYDLIINEEVQYKNKTYQDLMNLYHDSYNKQIQKGIEKEIEEFKSKLKYLESQMNKSYVEYIESTTKMDKIRESMKDCDDLKKLYNYPKKNEKEIAKKFDSELNRLKKKNKKEYEAFKKKKNDEKLEELKNLNSQQEKKISENYNNTVKEIGEKKNLYLANLAKYEEHKKFEKKYDIKQKFDNDNNVSRIKLYFLKKIYESNNPDTYSSLHLKKIDWDIGEIEYCASDEDFNKFRIRQTEKWENDFKNNPQQLTDLKTEVSKIQQSVAKLGQEINSSEEGRECMDKLNREVMSKDPKFVHCTSIGNKKIKTLEDIKKTRRNYMKTKRIVRNKATEVEMSNTNLNSSSQKRNNEEENRNIITG